MTNPKYRFDDITPTQGNEARLNALKTVLREKLKQPGLEAYNSRSNARRQIEAMLVAGEAHCTGLDGPIGAMLAGEVVRDAVSGFLEAMQAASKR